VQAYPIGYDSDVAEKTAREAARRVIAENRKARHDYHVIETFESGVALLGTEVKAIREGRVNLRDSYARVEGGQVWMLNVHISPYSHRGYAQSCASGSSCSIDMKFESSWGRRRRKG